YLGPGCSSKFGAVTGRFHANFFESIDRRDRRRGSKNAERRHGAARRRTETGNRTDGSVGANTIDHEVVRVASLTVDAELSRTIPGHAAGGQSEKTWKAPAVERQLLQQRLINDRCDRRTASIRGGGFAHDYDRFPLTPNLQNQGERSLIVRLEKNIPDLDL